MADKKKTTALVSAPSTAILEALRNEFPVEQGYTQNQLPRIGMFSQDVTEGKGKAMKVVTEAGTFFIDRESEEPGKDGKKEWNKEEIGDSIEAIVVFQRRQLRHYNESTEEYTSSPVFDFAEDEVPLFLNKKEVARGTAAELKALPQFQFTKDGKTRSSLEDNKILYVLYEGELFQMNLRGSSMFSYKTYAKSVLPPAVLTKFTSEYCEKGDISWNKMLFEAVRDLNAKEVEEVMSHMAEIKESIKSQKEFFATQNSASDKAKKELDEF